MAKKPTEPTVVNDAIATILKETGQSDPAAAVRIKARELIQLYYATFREKPPFDLKAMASMKGITHSEEAPVYSPDSELLPDDEGRLVMRINRDRPKTRQRFSIAHEITHTFFPGYEQKVQCRKPKERDWSDPEDVIEWLCDVGASEFLFPPPWFGESISACSGTAQGILDLARNYRASPDATVRRYVEIASMSLAAVFLTWKLKPTQQKTVRKPGEQDLFGTDAEEEALLLRKLRIEYSIFSHAFDAFGVHIPNDKSVENVGPIYKAAESGRPCDGECHLDIGQAAGTYRVHAVPLWTPTEELGPAGENAVAAVIWPLVVSKPKKNVPAAGVNLFAEF
jgi:Zn-dependent peptidase ImmA (M78 family)